MSRQFDSRGFRHGHSDERVHPSGFRHGYSDEEDHESSRRVSRYNSSGQQFPVPGYYFFPSRYHQEFPGGGFPSPVPFSHNHGNDWSGHGFTANYNSSHSFFRSSLGEFSNHNTQSYHQKGKPKAKDIRDRVRAVLFHIEKEAGKEGFCQHYQKAVLDYIKQWNNFQSLPSLVEIAGQLVQMIPEVDPHSEHILNLTKVVHDGFLFKQKSNSDNRIASASYKKDSDNRNASFNPTLMEKEASDNPSKGRNVSWKEHSSSSCRKRDSSSISGSCSGWNNQPSSRITKETDGWSAPQENKGWSSGWKESSYQPSSKSTEDVDCQPDPQENKGWNRGQKKDSSSISGEKHGWSAPQEKIGWSSGQKKESSSTSGSCSGWNNQPSRKSTEETDCQPASQEKKTKSTQTIELIAIDVEDKPLKKSNTEVNENPRQETNENEIVKKWKEIFDHGTINTEHEALEIKNAEHVFTDANTEEYFKGDIPFDKIVNFRIRWVSEFYRMELPVPKTFHTRMFLFQRHPLPRRHEVMQRVINFFCSRKISYKIEAHDSSLVTDIKQTAWENLVHNKETLTFFGRHIVNNPVFDTGFQFLLLAKHDKEYKKMKFDSKEPLLSCFCPLSRISYGWRKASGLLNICHPVCKDLKKDPLYTPKSCKVGRMKPFEFLQHLKSPYEKYRHMERRDILHDILAYYIYFLYSPKIQEVDKDWKETFGEGHFENMMEEYTERPFNLPEIETNPQLGNTAGWNGKGQVEDSDDKSSDSGGSESESETDLPDEQKKFSETFFTV